MAKRKKSSSGDASVLHFGGVRMRVIGSGNLQSILHSLSDVFSDTLANIPMQASTDVEPFLIANLTQQRAYLEVKTTAIDETFTISKIFIYTKPVAAAYPQ